MIKGSIQEEDIIIVNMYAPNIGAMQYVRQMQTIVKREISNNAIIVETLLPYSHLWHPTPVLLAGKSHG